MSKLMELGDVTRPQGGKRSANSGRVAIYRREVLVPFAAFLITSYQRLHRPTFNQSTMQLRQRFWVLIHQQVEEAIP